MLSLSISRRLHSLVVILRPELVGRVLSLRIPLHLPQLSNPGILHLMLRFCSVLIICSFCTNVCSSWFTLVYCITDYSHRILRGTQIICKSPLKRPPLSVKSKYLTRFRASLLKRRYDKWGNSCFIFPLSSLDESPLNVYIHDVDVINFFQVVSTSSSTSFASSASPPRTFSRKAFHTQKQKKSSFDVGPSSGGSNPGFKAVIAATANVKINVKVKDDAAAANERLPDSDSLGQKGGCGV